MVKSIQILIAYTQTHLETSISQMFGHGVRLWKCCKMHFTVIEKPLYLQQVQSFDHLSNAHRIASTLSFLLICEIRPCVCHKSALGTF